MCSIAGILGKSGGDVVPKLIDMLHATRHRGPDGAGICVDGRILTAESVDALALAGLSGGTGMGSARLAIVDGKEGVQPMKGCRGDAAIVFNGEIYNYRDLRRRLTGHSFETDTDTEVILHLFEQEVDSHGIVEGSRRTSLQLDGMYAFAILYGGVIVLGRDPLGIKPLYLGENEYFWAFASERKGLWGAGISSVKPLRPGSLTIFDGKQFMVLEAGRLARNPIVEASLSEVVSHIIRLLKNSVEKMAHHGRIGILFSGGLDSSMIAKLAAGCCDEAHLYCAAFPGSRDAVNAQKVAEYLGLRLRLHLLNLGEVEDEMPRILYAIEEPNVLNLAIAMPIYFACKLAKQDGIKVMLSAQGSDEIFGGYRRYEDVLRLRGGDALGKALWDDVLDMWRVNLQRDDGVSMAHGIELRVPFLDKDLVEYAMSVPAHYKIKEMDGSYSRKYVLRLAAQELGLPDEVVLQPKVAVQYGSGAMKALRSIARKHGCDVASTKRREAGSYLKTYVRDLATKLGIPLEGS